MADVGMRQRTTGSAYNPYETENQDDEDSKGHPAPAKQVGMGVMVGAGIAVIMILLFVYYIEEERWRPDLDMHAHVTKEHKKRADDHAHLSGLIQKAHEEAKNAPPAPPPTKEEEEHQKQMERLHGLDDELDDHEPEAEGMVDALGHQMHDTEIDLKHRLEEFWETDINKDAFISLEDFKHSVKRPTNMDEAAFAKLDTNKDGAIGIREWVVGFHDTVHVQEPWYHHKYGFVYGDEVPDHFKHAKAGAVRKGSAEHAAALQGLHPSQTHKKIEDKRREAEHKVLNEKAAKEEAHEEAHDDAHHDEHHDEHDEHDEKK